MRTPEQLKGQIRSFAETQVDVAGSSSDVPVRTSAGATCCIGI